MSRLRLFWVALVFLLASLPHFELHVYTIQTPAAKRLVAEKYKWQSSNLHPRFLRFKMCWCITTFKSYFSFPLVFTAAAHSEWEIFWPYKTLQDLVRPCKTLHDLVRPWDKKCIFSGAALHQQHLTGFAMGTEKIIQKRKFCVTKGATFFPRPPAT